MRKLDYQQKVLDAFDAYLKELSTQKARADKIAVMAAESPELGIPVPDFTADTWNALRDEKRLPTSETHADREFSGRTDPLDRPVPNVTLKVPTGGGKTYLAASAVGKVLNDYLMGNTGFVLWIVPNEAIYTQTLKTLRDRQHPYRQVLDRAAAGRVKVLEKTDPLVRADVDAQLCIMVLMLQSSNRQNQETLRMFRDRGDVRGFAPPEGDQGAHEALMREVPNLDGYDDMYPMVKDSLGNALRLIRPVVVVDEGQKAVSDLAHRTLYGFNPCFVLELTATPKDVVARTDGNAGPARRANLLVEVTGQELDQEGMIKMPLNVQTRQTDDWRDTLNHSLKLLGTLRKKADELRAETGRYIRPIMLVQVERTGNETHGSGLIHADDARDWLLTAGLDEAEIAIKTADRNDLTQPENLDLLAPTNRVRVIITKQALQEGWDCPFAYVLCALAVNRNRSAMTQLVGRILRQPHATKTEVNELDEAYVVSHRTETGAVVEAIKEGLEKDGLGDLVVRTGPENGDGSAGVERTIGRRQSFRSQDIYLPRVMLSDGVDVRPFDYETDLLSNIDWTDFDPSSIAERIPLNAKAAESQLIRLSLSDESRAIDTAGLATWDDGYPFDPSHAVRLLSDVVPNPFVAREIVDRLLSALAAGGFDEALVGKLSGLITTELRRALDKEGLDRAEALFRQGVKDGRIQFRLRIDGRDWRMPDTVETVRPDDAAHLTRRDGTPIQLSLFAPVYRDDLNQDERQVAVMLDDEKTVVWWHRNVARREYGVSGWRRGRIYPDFIFATGSDGTTSRLTVLETKGDHLSGYEDTDYKRDLLNVLADGFAWDSTVPVGELELVNEDVTVDCKLILFRDIDTQLPKLFGKEQV